MAKPRGVMEAYSPAPTKGTVLSQLAIRSEARTRPNDIVLAV